MTEHDLHNQYFEWLCDLVENDKQKGSYSYRKLFHSLHHINFQYSIGMDGNRDYDGIDLRYRFGNELSYPQPMIASLLDIYPCSVFEMMCALAIRCEEAIMNDPEHETGPYKWFWIMISNLGLESMDDENFNNNYVEDVIRRFLNRDYSPDGKGGLFIIKKSDVDLRNVEIWHQMCWYLDEYLNI